MNRISIRLVTVIMMVLILSASFVITETVFASNIKVEKTSEELSQSKNIQNKTDIEGPQPSIIDKLMTIGSTCTLKTNLEDGFVLRSSKKVFDVWAKKGGFKTVAQAELFRVNVNGDIKEAAYISTAWDDGNKQSFILNMSGQESGDFIIKVYAGGDSLQNASIIKEYSFTYQRTSSGGYIGDIIIDIEAFTLSLGYIEEPVRFPVYEGENAAQVLDRFLKEYGYTYDNTGSLNYGFYLGRIHGLKSIDLSLAELEEKVATKVNEEDYGWNKEDYSDGSLGEFDFTGYSGWMYSVNNIFPNVGFSDFYLDDGDVMRILFTVALGREIGASGSTGGWNPDFYAVANKDDLTSLLADINTAVNSEMIKDDNKASRLITNAINVNASIGASQDQVDEAYDALYSYLDKGSNEPVISLNASEITMRKDNTQKLEAEVTGISSLKPLHIKWSSDEPLIASVDNEGNVKAHRAGTVTVTCKAGIAEAHCLINVEEVPLEGIKLVPVTMYTIDHTDPWEEYKTENGYRLPTDIVLQVMVEPIPADTTDDLTPNYSVDTKRNTSMHVDYEYPYICNIHGLHDGITVLNVEVGGFTDQMEIEYYENKVQSFTCDDPEPVLSINGYGAVKKKQLTFFTEPSRAQDTEALHFASSDPNVFIVNDPPYRDDYGDSNPIKKTIYARNEGTAELYVTIGNITKTFPVQVYDLKESDSFVADDYANLSQTYSTEDIWKDIKLGGKRYRAGEPYYGSEDKDKYILSSSDPDLVLGTGGARMDDGSIYGGHSYDSMEWTGTTSWVPWLTGQVGTASITNKMYGKVCMISKVVVAEDVVPVQTIELRKDGEELQTSADYSLDDTFSIAANVLPEDATGELVWYSSDQNVATVDQEGNVSITGYGDADIVACIAGVYAVHKVHVDKPMTGMTISNEELNLTTDTSRTLMAWCIPNDTTDDHTITWTSNNPEIVSVTDKGRITTHQEGEATITASTEKYSITCRVIVDDQKLRQIYFPKSPVYIEKGETISLGTPKTIPESAHAEASEYTWSSSDEEYATVDQEGNVTLLKASPADREGGKPKTMEDYNKRVKIYAEKDGVKGECVIQTGSPITGLGFSSEEVTIYKGDEMEIELLLYPEDTTDSRLAITWVSSNDLAVSVRAGANTGKNTELRYVTGLKVGESTITARFEDYTASCKIKVVLPEDQQAAYDIQKKIEAWAELDPIADRADYVNIGLEIQEAWETFTDAQKKLVGGYNAYFAEHLEEIREMAASDKKVTDVISLIDSIGNVTLDDACKAKINAARAAFDALTDEQKDKVGLGKLQVLIYAELRIKELQDEADKQETIRKKKAAAKKLQVKGLKVKVKFRKFTLAWKKTKGASGYQIQYRKKGAKKFSSLKTTKLKVRTKKLKKNKKYQFRVRTYVKSEGKPVYGKWTRIKTVKCK